MNRTRRLEVQRPDVVHQTIDGEVVIINLATGTYYSLRAVGAEIWQLLERGATLDDVVAVLERRYDASKEAVVSAVDELVTTLADEGLLVPASDAAPPGNAPAAADGARRPWAPPTLERYTDMQDLLLVDPIHEVDDIGWPDLKPPGERQRLEPA